MNLPLITRIKAFRRLRSEVNLGPIFSRRQKCHRAIYNAFLGLALLIPAALAAPFTPGNLVIYRVGDGVNPLLNTGSAVFLDEYSASGSLMQSLPMPAALPANPLITASGTATSEGEMTRSLDGRFLSLTGYNATIPSTSSLPLSPSSSIYRTIGRVDWNGTLNASTVLQDFADISNPRSAFTTDGTSFWVAGGAGGVRYAPLGTNTTSTQVSSGTPTNLRQINVFDGQLYASTGSGTTVRLGTVGTGLGNSSGQAITNLPGFPTTGSPYGFFFADLTPSVSGVDTLYVADEFAGLQKFSLVAGTWGANGTIGTATDNFRGLTASVSGTTVNLYATIKGGATSVGGGELVKLTDTSGYNATISGTPNLLATAAPNTAFRGVALAPYSRPDLTVDLAAPATALVGSTFTYTLTARNIGNVAATGIGLRFTVPIGLTIGTINGASGFTGSTSGSVVSFSGGSLAVGASATLTVSVSSATAATYTPAAQSTFIDPPNNIFEADETNNSSTLIISTLVNSPPTPPAITTQPASQTIDSGATATLTVTATGTPPPNLQWYRGTSGDTANPVGVANSSSFTTPSLTTTTSYWVQATNTSGPAANSDTATITVTPPPAPEISLEEPSGTELTGGVIRDFGSRVVASSSAAKIFYVRNTGTATLQSLSVLVNGTHAADFIANITGFPTSLAPGVSASFTVTFTPGAAGARTAALSVASNDSDEGSILVNLTGTGMVSGTETVTVGFNFQHGNFVNTTSITEDENTATLNSAANLGVPSWNNISINGAGAVAPGSGTGTFGGITVSAFSSTQFHAGSESVGIDGDASQQVFRVYLDDGDGGNGYFNGDGIGLSIHVSGIQNFLQGFPGASDYRVTLFFCSDGNSNLFPAARVRQGVPGVPSATAISSLPLLGTTNVVVLGNGLQPNPAAGSSSGGVGGTRAWGELGGLTASDITISMPAGSVGNRATIAGFAITARRSLVAPEIISQPASQTIDSGATATLTVTATGTPPPNLQWYRGTSGDTANPVGVANSSSFTTPSLTTTTSYWVQATNTSGPAANSDTATITVTPPPAPEISLEEPSGTELIGGVIRDFGSRAVASTSLAKTFLVRNTGTATLQSLSVLVGGAHATDFTTNTIGFPTSLAAGASASFTITFTPGAAGPRVATLSIASNDADENPLLVNLSGTGVTPLQIAQQAYLKAGNTGASDQFGCAVAISGDTVVVGALNENSSTTGVNSIPDESAPQSGAAYVFTRNGTMWTQQAYLKASNTESNDSFGVSVAISGDTIVVGAFHEDSDSTGVNSTPNNNVSDAGAAYVFTRTGTTWTQQAYLKASVSRLEDRFGYSVSVSGNTIVVGVPEEDSSTSGVNSTPNANASSAGAAYVFARTGGSWAQQAYLKADNTEAGDHFGTSVAVSGDVVVVGADLEDSSTIGVNSVSNNSATSAGAAYVFNRDGTTWTQQAYLKASNTGALDYFGNKVAVSGDTVAVGALQEDSSSVGINSSSDELASDSGAVYVYRRDGTTWTQQAYLKASNTGTGDNFGSSVAISCDMIAVGAYWEDGSATGVDSTSNESAQDSGAAYLFNRVGTVWTQQAYLKASNTGTSDYFGQAVAVFGDTVVIGAARESSSTTGVNGTPNEIATDAGAAYTFLINSPPAAPRIINQPANEVIPYESSASLFVEASGSPSPSYQWYQGSSGVTTNPISGATSATFTTPALTTTTNYWVRVTNTTGTANSETATVTVSASTLLNLALQGNGGTGLLPGNENPIVIGSLGSGGEIGSGCTYNTASRLLTIRVGWGALNGFTNLTSPVIAAHIHGPTSSSSPASYSQNASLIINLTSPEFAVNYTTNGGSIIGTTILSAANESALLSGKLYIDLHTIVNGGGEIRGNLVVQVAAPEISIQEPSATEITTGAVRNFDTTLVGAASAAKTFQIRNTGDGPLQNIAVIVTGSQAGDFTADLTSVPTALAPGASASFSIIFTPGATGARIASLIIASDDADENPTVITLSGIGTNAPIITTQPLGQSIVGGTTTNLVAAASGSPTPTFQWYQGISGDISNPISGATNASFTTPALTIASFYWVRALNSAGSADSNTAVVSILSSDASLLNLILSSGSLTPTFLPGTLSYRMAVSNNIFALTLSPIVSEAGTTVLINGNSVASAAASPPITLNEGETSIPVVATSEDGMNVQTYTVTVTRALAPILATQAADTITATTALLKGAATPNDVATVFFEYGTTTGYGSVTAGRSVSGSSPIPIDASLTGLAAGTLYHFRLVAQIGAGTVFGNDMTFSTEANPPTVATGSPVAVTASSATLVGAVNPNGPPAQVRFEYGLTTLYGSTTPVQNIAAGNNILDVLAPITGLIAGANYHCRIIATTTSGTSIGADVSFLAAAGTSTGTGTPTAVPGVTTQGTAAVELHSAELLGSVNPNGGTTVVLFEYGTTTSYGLTTEIRGYGNGTTSAAVSLSATGLLPGTVYHYRLRATNSLGTAPGSDATFTTSFSEPVVVTGKAEALSTTSATVFGTVRARNAAAEVFVDYGTNPTTLTNSVRALPTTVSGDSVISVSGDLINLTQGTTYYYQFRAVNSGGTGRGLFRSFDLGVLSGLFQDFPDAIDASARQGSVTVDLSPIGIGGGWRFAGEQSWRASGASVTGMATGDRVIEFRPVPGYLPVSNESVSVVSGAVPVNLARTYLASATTGSGGLTVNLKPETLASESVPAATRAQWRLFGESESQWKDSGSSLTGLVPGDYVIECKTVSGRSTPPLITTPIADGETTAATITYFIASDPNGTPPSTLSFTTVSTREDRPFAYVGQISSNVGASTGFVVRPRVVATAGHVVFDDGTLSAVTGLQWQFQRDRGTYEPVPLIPRGYYLMSGYAAQRAIDNSPGTSSPQSQNLDAAALYFLSDAGRGGYSGYLASDALVNEFVTSSALKTLVGYPVDGIPPDNQGRMHATPVANVAFAPAFGQTYTTSDIRSSGGNSGGPLCIQHESGVYYPAAIYLGGTAQTVVRAIDGDVVDLFGFAESSANAEVGSSGGSITQSSTSAIGTPGLGALKVIIQPASARAAGAGWRIQAQAGYEASGVQKNDLSPNIYTVQFASVSGFEPPTPQSITINGGQLTSITFTYEIIVSPPVITSANAVTGTRGQSLSYQINATNAPEFFSLLGSLPSGMTFNENTGLISGTPQEAGTFPVTLGATNSGGADTRVVTITSRPVLDAQSVTVPFQQPMSYAISSSESGEGLTFSSGALPAGVVLDALSGQIIGTPVTPGVFTIPISLTKQGATASAILTLNITGTTPVFTLQPLAAKSIEHGLSTTLTAVASGLPAPTYQWYQGNQGVTTNPIAGATSATFITPILTSNTRFWVRASNSSGSANSESSLISLTPSSNANLGNLIPGAGSLSPAFNPGVATYTATVPYSIPALSLTPEAQNSQASILINGISVSSGLASPAIALAVGSNVINTEVMAGDGSTVKAYRLTVTRSAPPVITTVAATGLTDATAVLRGTVTPNSPVSVLFQYGRTTSYGSATAGQNVSGTVELPIQTTLSGLTGDTIYHYRAVALAGSELLYGEDMTFSTTLERPLAATGNPAGVSTSAATLIGAVNPRGLATSVYFDYGLTPALGNLTPTQNLPAGANVVDVLASISNLTPSATYYYRVVATSIAGTSFGNTVSFSATSGGGTGDGIVDNAPTVTTGGVADVTTSSAVLLGMVNPNEGTTFANFEYGVTVAYGSTTESKGIGNGNQAVNVTLNATNLLPGVLYHYRLVGSNSLGIVNGADATFTAGFNPPLVTTGAAQALTSTSARINGRVRSRGTAADIFFDFGPDMVTFTHTIRAFQQTVIGDEETPVNVDLLNLDGAATYYYRLRAVSSGGTATGDPLPLRVGALLGLVQEFTAEVSAGDREGQVQVNLLPAGMGGWRFSGESQWRASGAVVTNLTTGERDIEFQPVTGQIQPLTESVGIVSGEPMLVLERNYYEAAEAGNGVLRVLLEPESLTTTSVPVANRAQWRLAGDLDPTWKNSGDEVSALLPGSYLVECKAIPGRNTPSPRNILVEENRTSTASITYFPAGAPSLTPPEVIPFETVSSTPNLPYGYVGQVRSDTGTHSGFVVKTRVVATVAQAVFDDATLSTTTGLQWLLQRDQGHYEPDPQIPRGFYIFDGYAAQRTTEATPGTLAMESQNLNVAALYFSEDAGRGGLSGFLSSDAAANEFLQSPSLKTLVGYPVNGISAVNQGRMHATPPETAALSLSIGRTFITSAIRGNGGMTGGPLCVQYNGGNYYPAGIYVGGTTQGAFRAIDSSMIDLFSRAEVSGNGGDNNTGGGITHTSVNTIGTSASPGAVSVIIQPAAARSAGAGWRLSPESTFRTSGLQKSGLNAGNYALQLTTVAGFQSPTQQSVRVNGGQLSTITFTYAVIVPKPIITSGSTRTGTRGQSFNYSITAANSPSSYSLTGNLPNGISLNPASGLLSGTLNEAGVFPVTLKATNAGGFDTQTLTITCRPAVSSQSTNVPLGQYMSYQIITSESGTGRDYTATGLPDGTTLNESSGRITGVPTESGVFGVHFTVAKGGATSVSATLTLTVSATPLEIWRMANFNTVNNTGTAADNADPDGDGQSNLAEFVAGTGPGNPGDVFKVQGAAKQGAAYEITAQGKAGRTYYLQRTADLSNGTWTTVASSAPLSVAGMVTLTDPSPVPNAGFYRIQVFVP